MARRKGGPTDLILTAARGSPGGVIRWSEAEEIYKRASDAVRSHIPIAVSRIFDRHFTKVEGVKGFYVLTETIFNDDWEEDSHSLEQHVSAHGRDEFGMSHEITVPEPQLDDINSPYWRGLLRMSQIGVAP